MDKSNFDGIVFDDEQPGAASQDQNFDGIVFDDEQSAPPPAASPSAPDAAASAKGPVAREIVQMSQEKPGPAAISATAGKEGRVEQVAPDLFVNGDMLFDSAKRTVKPGQFVTLSRKDGTSQLLSFEGSNDDGKPVFKDVEGITGVGADLAGEIDIDEDDYSRMFSTGKAKKDRSPLEQVRLQALADTGDAFRYTDDVGGTFNALYDYFMPFLGGSAKKAHNERTRHLSNIREGRLNGYAGETEAEKIRDAARKAGLEPWNPLESLHPGESDEAFLKRIRKEADDDLRLDAAAKQKAAAELGNTEATVGDKIVKGGITSGAFALQFAIPGSIMFKGLSTTALGAKAIGALTTLGSAIPATIAEADARYSENITPEYGWKMTSLDGEPEFGMIAAPDSESEAAYKAIGGAVFDTAVEVGLEAATMGLLRLAGKPAGWVLGKVTPGAVKEWGAKNFNKFVASETGQALRQINRAYQDFSGMTQINSPLGELAEENVQALEKTLGLEGKSSEYKGLAKEWQDFKDKQLNWQTQWDIFYGLIAQLAIGSANSTAHGIAQHVSSADARRDVRMALKRSGISDETISTLTPKQQKTLTDMWQRYSADPDALKDRVKNLGYSMRAAVDELTARDGLKMRQSLEQRGIAPERFTIQTGEDGKPAFQQMMRFTPDGKQAPMNAMTDAAHGVTIVDQGDGTFYVMNDLRGLDAIPASSFEDAQKKADAEVVRNQSKDADNEQKAQYLMGLVQRQYAGRNVVSIPSEAALRWQVAQAVHDGRPLYGITRADQLFREDGSLRQPGAGGFHTPDGHIVVILDNVPSPAEMERVLAHEATGHEGVESATGRGANTVEFIQNAQAEGFSRFVEGERQRAIQRFVASGMDETTATAQVDAAMATDDYKRESMARYAQGRLHAPTWYERRKHEANERRRAAGENMPIDQADLEVMLAEQEAQGRAGENELETLNADSGVRYEEGAADEAGNRPDEAPAQPEQGEERGQEAPRPEAGAEPGAEAPDAGVVAKSNTVEDLRDASDKASQALQDAEGRLSKWLKDHPRQETEDGRVSYGNGGTVREFRELEAAVDAAREKSESAEAEYRKAKRAENAERQKSEEQKKLDAKKRRDEERKKWRDENPVTAQLEDLEKNVLLPAENELEDLLDSDASTNEQKAEAYRKVREARKVVDDFKNQHKEELEQEAANRKARENANEGSVEQSKSDNGGQNLTEPERPVPADSIGGGAGVKKPKGRRGHNLKGFSYEDYGAHPDDGGTGDVMGAALLRYAKENGGILVMPNKGDPDPLADWIDSFLDGNARKNRRGAFIALFGMSPRRGGNDALTEGMPPELEVYLNRIIESRGIEAVPEMLLRAREDFAKWVGDKRRAQAEAKNAPQTADEGDVVSIAEIEARDAADAEYDNAYAEVERYEAGSPVIRNFSREQMRTLKRGDVLRFDHADTSWEVVGYDAENDIVTVVPQGALDNPLMTDDEIAANMVQYRVSADGAEEVKPEKGKSNGRKDERGTAEAVAGDAQGATGGGTEAQGGGFQLESVTAEQITAENKKRAEKEAIKKRQEAPLKGGGPVDVQPEMDLGQTGQQDLFSPIAENDNTSTDRATEALKSFLDGKGVEKAVESLREFSPQALTARSFDELMKVYTDRLAAWTKDNDAWTRMKSRWGVGRSAETKDEKALQRKVNGGRGALDYIKNMLEFGFPKEFAAFKNLPPAEQARRLGLDVKETGGRVVVTGNTYPLRDMLKDAGFKWDSSASVWTADAAEPPKSAPASAPSAEGTTTPPKSADAPQGGESAENATPAAKPEAPRPVSPVKTGEKPKKPAFKRGDRVFIKGAKDGQRVTFLKANADGTADVQVRTPGANRYAPEKVETRTVPMGDISATGMKDTLTDAERKRLAEGMRAQQTIVMPNAAAAKEVRDAFDAIDFDTPELSSDGGKFLEWASKWKLDPSKKKYQREWAQRNRVSFDTPEFDPDKFGRLVTGVGNLVDKLTKYGYNDFKSLATYIYEQDAAKYGRAKPVLQDIWNAVARARGLARVSDAQADEVYADIEKPQEAAPAPEAPKPPPANKLMSTRISDAAEEIIKEINSLALQGKVLTRKRLTEIVENQLGGKVANGDIEAKQVTDILELAVNRHLKASWFAPNGNAEAAVLTIHNLREYLKLIPTQSTRSIEQDKMQQFSTPPTEAFAAAWVANMDENDVMLEPSAGIGGIAVFGANAGAKVITNELSPRRAEILEQLGIGKPFEFNAENLYAFLEPDIKAGKLKRPTVVVMNPPFSNSQRTDKKNTHIGADHVEQALKLLAPGGRLVAVVGNGMAHDRPAFKAWWDRIGREYTVRANVGVNGQEYVKYGTTFDNNIIVIDKVTPNGSITPIYGKIESLDELPALLEGVRNDRPIVQSNNRSKLDADRQSGDRGVEGLPGRGVHSTPAGRDAQVLPERHQQAGSDRAAGVQDSGRGPNAAGRGGGGLARPGQGAGRRLGSQDNGVPVGRGTGRREDAGGNGREDANALDSGSVAGGGILQPDAERGDLRGLEVQSVAQVREIADGTFSEYRPSKISIPGMKPHPTALVESSAMASVQPPNPTYSPKIPKKIIEDGVLSEAQIEQVIYAGQAHEQMLGNGERKGYFIGDGTGVGKGREISGIILDNFNNGRRKAVWVSEKSKLFNDAKRDLSPFGLGDEVFTLESKNLKKFGVRAHGVAFTTYDSLATYHAGVDPSGVIRADPRAKGGSRMQLLAKWLGKDFDGVIVFDESHNAANAVAKRGKRGMTKPSAKALAVVDLQNLLPKARIVYVSATGATEVSNLAYAMRLGLWGKGTAFKDRDAFINQVSAGGLSVMEIVARDMKAMGVYMARTLSYEGIENERVTHELSPDQVKQYNLLADTWQMVMGEVENALISSNGIKSGQRVSNVKGAFWGAHQRFFNQILTTMQMPSVLTKAREAWDAGYSPVFQLVNTNESTQKKAIEKARKSGDDDIENLDLSPREILIGYVEQSFPTVQYVEEQTDGGKTEWRPLPDGNGGFVHDPAAVERKERLIGRLQRMKIGESPLDMILNEFGHENVAEITGRTSRREMVRNADGEMEMKLVNRSEKKRQQEIVDFQDGKRTVLVFSDAGGTGASYHADRNFKNQRRRMHFLIQPGYNAAKAIQGLGRTHRSNESSHPLYELCSTNLPGHKRFMSTIARRLAQLGSLTSGDRSSSGSGVFSEADNLENQYAKDAVLSIFEEMFMEDPAKFNRICTEMGFMRARVNSKTGEREYVNTLLDEDGEFDAADKLDIPHFLNRILAMKIDAQNELFDEFSKRMAEDIERAKENGTFDPGMEKLKGITVEVKNRTRLWEDAQKIGSTDIVEVGVTKKSRKTDYAKAKSQLEYYAAAGAVPRVYTHNGSGDVLMMVETKQTKTMKDGSIVTLFRRLKPNGEADNTTETAVEKNYTQVLRDEEGVWTRAYEATPDLIEQSRFFANGTLLPIWDRLGATNPRFFKVAPTGGAETQTFLGMEIAPENVENVLARFGKSVGAVEVTPDVQLRRVMKDGKKVELQNGWTLKRVKVLGDNRIEIDGVDEDADVLRLAQEPFAYTEKIGYLRVFLKPNAESLRDFLAEYPAVPDKGGLATASGTAQDLSGDKYKAPLRAYWSRIESATPAEATALGEQMRGFIVRLSSEQLGEIFDDYAALDNDSLSAAHVVRRMALDELVARGALDWRRRQQAESESPGGDIVNFDTPELDGVNFDTKELSQAEGYEASEKRPIEDDQLIGFTKEDVAHSRRVLGMVPLTHTARTDAERHMMADALLSRSGYGQKLAHAVANFGRTLSDYEQTALGKYRAQRLAAVNEAKLVADAMQTAYDALPKDAPVAESQKALADLKAAKAELQTAMGLLDVADRADDKAGTAWGQTGRARQDTVKLPDMSWGGITRGVAQTFGGSEKIPQELMPMIEDAVKEYEKADEMQKKVVAAQFEKALDKAFSAAKNGAKIRRAVEHREGEEAKRAEKNYLEALAQFQVGAEETGGTLIGLADQRAPGWGKWLRYLAEYHCFMNPDIKVDECVAKMIEDLKECGMTAVDEVQVWEAWTGYGHSFRQSRFESQRRANWLKEQALHLAQLHHMDETNTMPEATGMIRDEDPTQEGRDLKKKVYDRKKEVPDAERDERHLKSVYDSIKRALDNRIADLKHAIETGERIPPRNRTVREDLEIRQKRKERDELQAVYDGMFGTTRTLTPEQRIAMAEKAMSKILERDLEDIARAEKGDFSKIEGRPTVNDRYVKTLETNLGKAHKTDSPALQAMREKHLENVKQMLALKKAKFEYGMTPEEIAAHNAKKLANLDKRIAHYAEIFTTGDLRRNVSRQPPMTPEQQKQFDEKEEQLKKAQRKLAELRLETLRATAPKWSRNLEEYGAFILAAQRALKTTIDFSSMFNQAAGMTISHPLKAIGSFGKAWSAMWSDARMAAINDEIMSDPQIQEAIKKYGLHLREVDADNGRDVDMFKGMESQTVKLFGKRVAISDIPFYGKLMLASERHYITYLNAMSAELYVHIANGLNERFPGGMTPWMKKQLCDMINIWNGSGALTKEKRRAWQEGGISNFFFSLPLLTSQVQTIFWRDALRPLSQEGLKNEEGVAVPVTDAERKTMAKIGAFEHVKMAVATLALSALLRWIFADDDDRWQFDGANWFEKLIMAANPKIGNTTLDFTGGTATTYRLLYKIASGFFTGKVKTGSGRSVKYGGSFGTDASRLVSRFLEGRVAPWLSTALSVLNKKNFVGEPYGAWEAAKDMFVPMSLEDSYEQIDQNGFAPSLFTIPLTIAGVRAQTYDRKPYENAVNTFLEAEKEYGDYATDGNLGEADRKAVLDEMKASNPLLADGVRDRLIVRRKGGNAGLIPNAQRAERQLKKLQADPNASKSDIAEAELRYHKTREDVMKFIRENRRGKPSGGSSGR